MKTVKELNDRFFDYQKLLIDKYRLSHENSIDTDSITIESLMSNFRKQNVKHLVVPSFAAHILFFIRNESTIFLGLHIANSINNSDIEFPVGIDYEMLIGVLDSFSVNAEGIHCFIRPINFSDKKSLFSKLCAMKNDVEISYPFIQRDVKGEDFIWPDEFWSNLEEPIVKKLNNEESFFREMSCDLMKSENLSGKVVYDPACSSGEFLKQIYETYPEAIVIGSDCSEGMIKIAKKVLPNVYFGYAGEIELTQKIDYLFIRFINMQVISLEEGYRVFKKLNSILNDSARIIIFGRTPVLLNINYLCSEYDLKCLQRICASPDKAKLYQFYVLQKN